MGGEVINDMTGSGSGGSGIITYRFQHADESISILSISFIYAGNQNGHSLRPRAANRRYFGARHDGRLFESRDGGNNAGVTVEPKHALEESRQDAAQASCPGL